MGFEAILGLFFSIIINIIFSIREIRQFIMKWEHRRVLYQFWGKPKRNRKNIFIYYPSYPSPRVGRTQKETGYYLSNEDAKAVEKLEETLFSLGFICHRKITSGPLGGGSPFPKDCTVVLVCGPKIDPSSNQIVYDPWIGGNSASSFFYLRYLKAMGIDLIFDGRAKRKEYRIFNQEPLHSPMDEPIKNLSDKGLLIRLEINNQYFILCWGIHSYATLATVDIILDHSNLVTLPLKTKNIVGIVEACWDRDSEVISASVIAIPFKVSFNPLPPKPHPFSVESWVPVEKPVFGLSYLWASRENIVAIKQGDYSKLKPIATELDLSFACPYRCDWCLYRPRRTGEVLKDPEEADKIVEKLHEWGIRLVVLTGGGEPLVSPCVERVTDNCSKHDMLVTLYTNGLYLNDLRAFHLMSRGISEIRISLDDVSTPHNYMTIHGLESGEENCLDIVKSNCIDLLNLRGKNGFGTRIGISFLVSDKTLINLKKSAEVIETWLGGVGPFDYVVFRPPVNYWGQEQYLNINELNDARITEAASLFKTKGIARHTLISYQRFKDIGRYPFDDAYKTCLASNLWLNIGPDGSAYLCCETKHISTCRTGNIFTNTLGDLLENQPIQQKRNLPYGTKGCPTRLCKPSALNLLFHQIEDKRDTNKNLPRATCRWLDEMQKYSESVNLRNIIIPSVSGIYDEYSQGAGNIVFVNQTDPFT